MYTNKLSMKKHKKIERKCVSSGCHGKCSVDINTTQLHQIYWPLANTRIQELCHLLLSLSFSLRTCMSHHSAFIVHELIHKPLFHLVGHNTYRCERDFSHNYLYSTIVVVFVTLKKSGSCSYACELECDVEILMQFITCTVCSHRICIVHW